MRREVYTERTEPLSVRPPSDALTDGVVTLRLPDDDDIGRLTVYGADQSLREGVWIAGPRDEAVARWAERTIHDWSAGWTPAGGIDGAVFIVDEQEPFVGVVTVVPHSAETVELVYGVSPSARRRGIATRAVCLASDWLLSDGGFAHVELRIAEHHDVSQRVAAAAGFRFVERFETFVPATGLTAKDRLYARDRR